MQQKGMCQSYQSGFIYLSMEENIYAQVLVRESKTRVWMKICYITFICFSDNYMALIAQRVYLMSPQFCVVWNYLLDVENIYVSNERNHAFIDGTDPKIKK